VSRGDETLAEIGRNYNVWRMDDFEVVMTFPARLRADENFVIESVAKEFAGIWECGVRGNARMPI
jgi:hypothetical protein